MATIGGGVMTTDIERKFFDTFGIEPNKNQESELVAIGENIRGLKRVEKPFYDYPQITDRILLELICIAMDITDFGASNVEGLKEVVLTVLVEYTDEEEKEEIKQQVQALFKEG